VCSELAAKDQLLGSSDPLAAAGEEDLEGNDR